MDVQKMMQQAQQMQHKMMELQEMLKDIIVEGDSGDGLVKVSMNCGGVIKTLEIRPDLLTSGDKETIEDLVIAAINNTSAIKEVRIQEETRKMMQGMGLPDGTKLPK